MFSKKKGVIFIGIIFLVITLVSSLPEPTLQDNSHFERTILTQEDDYNLDGIVDVYTTFTQIDSTTIEIYVNQTSDDKKYKWQSAIFNIEGLEGVQKEEYNPATDVWTNTGDLVLYDYQWTTGWNYDGNTIGYSLFGAGSGDKQYRLILPEGEKTFKIFTGQGSEEVLYTWQNNTLYIYPTDIFDVDPFTVEVYCNDIKIEYPDMNWTTINSPAGIGIKFQADVGEGFICDGKITFRQNKIKEIGCSSFTFYQSSCSNTFISYSDFETSELNNITNKTIEEHYSSPSECFIQTFPFFWNIDECVGTPDYYSINYYGLITDLDPEIELVYSVTTNGFFNQTNVSIHGVSLIQNFTSDGNFTGYNNTEGDFKYFVFYNSTSTYWNVTMNIADSTGDAVTYDLCNGDVNCVSYWDLDTGGTDANPFNDEKGGNDGTPTGTNNATGLSSGAMSFDGDDYIYANDDIADNEDFTVTGWVQFLTDLQDQRVLMINIQNGDASKQGIGFGTMADGSSNYFRVVHDGVAWGSGTTVPNLDEWYFFTYTNVGTTSSLYLNANSVAISTYTGTEEDTGDQIQLGMGMDSGGGNNFFLDGVLDEVLIYNKSLTATEVQDLYKAGLSQHANANITLETRTATSYNVSDAGLVGLWSFNNDNSTTAFDETGRNNGTLVSMQPANEGNGTVGKGYWFDGGADYINVGSGGELDFESNGNYTISAWTKTTDTDGMIVGRLRNTAGGNNLQLRNSNNHLFVFLRGTEGSSTDSCEGTTTLNDGVWHHVVYKHNNTGLYGYMDGILECSDTTINNDDGLLSDDYWLIGAVDTVSPIIYLDGSIDEVRIYNRSLSADEIQDLYELGDYHLEWSAWDDEGLMSDGVPKGSTSTGNFLQFRANFNTNDTSVSSYLLNHSIGVGEAPIIPDTESPVISNVKFWAMNSSGDVYGGNEYFNTGNLTMIEKMKINFTLNDESGFGSDIIFYYTANGTEGCARGNLQNSVCYNFGNDTWIEVQNGTNTSTFNDVMTAGDYINISYITINATQRVYTVILDETYNPNTYKKYDALWNNLDVKWQDGASQKITKDNYIMITADNDVPLDADQYKIDFRVNYTRGVNEPSQPLEVHACNETYLIDAGNPDSNSNCELIAEKMPSELLDDGTKFRAVETDNVLNNVGIIHYFIFDTDENNPNKYYFIKTIKATAIGYTTDWNYTTDGGATYTNLGDGYETEANINTFYNGADPTAFLFKIWVNDSLDNNANSSVYNMTWNINPNQNYPPLIDIIVPEVNATINGTININWTTVEPNNDNYTTNVTANDGVTTIDIATALGDTIMNTTWDTSLVSDGWWNITVESCENDTAELYCKNATHEVFVLDTTYPNFYSPWDDNSTLIGSGTASFNISINNTNGTAFLEIDEVNYTATNVTYNVYNVSISLSGFGNYSYYWGAYGNETDGLYNTSNIYYYSLNGTTAPIVTISEPENTTYTSTRTTLNYSFTNTSAITNCWYSLDEGVTNVSVPDIRVTGTITPDATGDYFENGTWDGNTVYSRNDGDYSVWYESSGIGNWRLTQSIENETYVWVGGEEGGIPEGEYPANIGTTGTAIVSLASCGNNLTGLDSGEGSSAWTVWVNNTNNDIGSDVVTFFVDFPPILILLTPLNTTYLSTEIDLNGTCTDTYSSTTNYSLDYGTNTSFTFNTTISTIGYERWHDLNLYCYDEFTVTNVNRRFYVGSNLTDTNATTECDDGEILRGDGECVPEVNYTTTYNDTYDSLINEVAIINNSLFIINNSLNNLSQDFQQNITQINLNLTNIWLNLSETNQNLSSVWGNISLINLNITNLWLNISDINNNLTYVWGNISNINTNLTSVWIRLDDINTNVTDIFGNITQINTNLSNVWLNISSIQTNLTYVWNNISDIKNNLTSVGNKLNELSINITSLYGNLSELNITLTNQIGNLSEDFLNLNSSFYSLNDTMTNLLGFVCEEGKFFSGINQNGTPICSTIGMGFINKTEGDFWIGWNLTAILDDINAWLGSAVNTTIGGYLYITGNQIGLNSTDLNKTITDITSSIGDTQKGTSGIFLYNDTTLIYLNDTQLNLTIDQIASLYNDTSWVLSQGYLTQMINDGVTIKYQNITNLPTCTGNQKLTFDGSVLSCAEDIDSNITDTQKKADGIYLFNDTTTIYLNGSLLNLTIDEIALRYNNTDWVIAQGYLTSESDPLFLAENVSLWLEAQDKFNASYSTWDIVQNYTGDECPAGQYAYAYLQNGTPKCRADIDTTIPDTNESTRVGNIVGSDCAIGYYIYGFQTDGTPLCREDTNATSGGTTTVTTTTKTCKYKKFGYYNPNLPSLKEQDCI